MNELNVIYVLLTEACSSDVFYSAVKVLYQSFSSENITSQHSKA